MIFWKSVFCFELLIILKIWIVTKISLCYKIVDMYKMKNLVLS